jgi:hypothetical protein
MVRYLLMENAMVGKIATNLVQPFRAMFGPEESVEDVSKNSQLHTWETAHSGTTITWTLLVSAILEPGFFGKSVSGYSVAVSANWDFPPDYIAKNRDIFGYLESYWPPYPNGKPTETLAKFLRQSEREGRLFYQFTIDKRFAKNFDSHESKLIAAEWKKDIFHTVDVLRGKVPA